MPHLLPIRPARLPDDADRILEVFAAAKGTMVADDNTKQWGSDGESEGEEENPLTFVPIELAQFYSTYFVPFQMAQF